MKKRNDFNAFAEKLRKVLKSVDRVYQQGYNKDMESNGALLEPRRETMKTNQEAILKANKYGIRHAGEFASWYTAILQIASELGERGIDLASCPIVTGYRYGSAPERGISTNYAAGSSERGLSLAAVDGGKETGSCMWFADRARHEYTGILLPYKGSDGEPLILAFGFDNYDA